MYNGGFTHIGFSDESHWSQGRYRSVALVSARLEDMTVVERRLKGLVQESGFRELSWSKIRSAKAYFAATKVCDLIAEMARNQLLRVDALIWDTQDSRHKIAGRDDTQNLARMYYHLLSNVIAMRWPSTALWKFGVDERTDMNWKELVDCLSGQTRRERSTMQRTLSPAAVRPRRIPSKVEQISSSEQPVVQVADLFAGLGAFSWNQREHHQQWKVTELPLSFGQQTMFNGLAQFKISRSAKYKHELLHHFASLSRPFAQMKGHAGEGLRSYRPDSTINYWLYVPQQSYDKAPQKSQTGGRLRPEANN